MKLSLLILCALLLCTTACETQKPSADGSLLAEDPVSEDEVKAVVPKEIEVIGLGYYATNYSVAPSMRSSKSMSLNGEDFEPYKAKVNALISELKVNDVVTLNDYIMMSLKKDSAGLAKVSAADPKEKVPQRTGAATIDITLYLKGDVQYKMSTGDRDFLGSGTFIELMKEHGSSSVSSAEKMEL